MLTKFSELYSKVIAECTGEGQPKEGTEVKEARGRFSSSLAGSYGSTSLSRSTDDLQGPGSFSIDVYAPNGSKKEGVMIAAHGFRAFDSFKSTNRLGIMCLFFPKAAEAEGRVSANGFEIKNKYCSFKTYLEAFKDGDAKLAQALKAVNLDGTEIVKDIKAPDGSIIPEMSLIAFAETQSR